jgi:hypothetical protein
MEDFNFWFPLDIVKSGKGKNKMRIRGFASTADVDTDEEVLEPTGFVLDRLVKSGYFNYDHRARENPMYIVGEPDIAKIVDGKLYVEGNLYDTPLAKDIFEFAGTLQKSGSGRRLGFSIEGKALERDPFNQKRITKALLTGIAITPTPKNSNTIMDVVKGESSTPFIDYEFETNDGGCILEKEDKEAGVRYIIDKDLNIIKKSIDTNSISSLMKESLEGVDPVKMSYAVNLLKKAMDEGRLSDEQAEKFRVLLGKIKNLK